MVIKSLASKLNAKVKFGKKSGRKENLLPAEKQQWVRIYHIQHQEEETMYTLVLSTKSKSMLETDTFYGKSGTFDHHYLGRKLWKVLRLRQIWKHNFTPSTLRYVQEK